MRLKQRPVLTIEEDSVTVRQMMDFVARRLSFEEKPISLRRLLAQSRSERALIATFLALLELVRMQAVLLLQKQIFGDILIKKNSGFEAALDEIARSAAAEDWR